MVFDFLVRVGTCQVEYIRSALWPEFTSTGEFIELILDEAMHGFHIALIGVRSGRDAQMLAIAQRGGEAGALSVAILLPMNSSNVVGLPGQIAQRHAPTVHAECERRRRRFAAAERFERKPRTANRCELRARCIPPSADASSAPAPKTAEYRINPWYRRRFVETGARSPDGAVRRCRYFFLRLRISPCSRQMRRWPCGKR